MKNTLSVCMIVKNEEDVLKRILSQIKQFADEIIVVDTGSTDNTVEIAKKYTKNIYLFPWQNDFSKARNFSFSKASCDFIMWLDADDYISQDDIKKLIVLKNSQMQCDVYYLKYVIEQKNLANFEFFRERIVRRSKNFAWHGFVHEVLTTSGKTAHLDIAILHKKQKVNEKNRNLKLYEFHKKQGATFSPREQYYYLRELFYAGKTSKAILEIKKFLKTNPTFYPDILGATILLCKCYLLKNQNKQAKNLIFNFLKTKVPNAELICLLAQTFENEHNIKNAIFWYQNALNFQSDLTTGVFEDKSFSTIIPALELTKLCYKTDKTLAKEYFLLSKEFSPNHPSVLYNQKFFN